MAPINIPDMSAALQISAVTALGQVIDQLKAAQLALMNGKVWQGSVMLSDSSHQLSNVEQRLSHALAADGRCVSVPGDQPAPFTCG